MSAPRHLHVVPPIPDDASAHVLPDGRLVVGDVTVGVITHPVVLDRLLSMGGHPPALPHTTGPPPRPTWSTRDVLTVTAVASAVIIIAAAAVALAARLTAWILG